MTIKKILSVISLCIVIYIKVDAQNVPLMKTLGYADLGIAPVYYGKIDTIIFQEFELDTTGGKPHFIKDIECDDIIVTLNEQHNMLVSKRYNNKKNRYVSEVNYTYNENGMGLKEMKVYQLIEDSTKNIQKVNDFKVNYHYNQSNKIDSIFNWQIISGDTFSLQGIKAYSYRPNGKVAIETGIGFSTKIVHIYDEKERKIEEISYYDEKQQNIDERKVFTYNNKNKIILEQSFDNKTPHSAKQYLYTKNSITIIDSLYFYTNKELTKTHWFKHIYTFNKRKLITKIEFVTHENLTGSILTFRYTFDKHKNWIRRDDYENGVLTEYVTRKFIYN